MPDRPAPQSSARLVYVAGFLAGALGSLALIGLVSVIFSGGFSDTPRRLPPVYVVE